jgi:hypothetical protein
MLATKILQELKTHASDLYYLTAITIPMEADTIADEYPYPIDSDG